MTRSVRARMFRRAPRPRLRLPSQQARRARPRVRVSSLDSDLHVAEPGRRRSMGDVCALPRLALPAVRQSVEAPGVASRDGVELPPELGRDARVGRVAEHPAELAALDLPRDLRPELEVEALVVDRPALVRL